MQTYICFHSAVNVQTLELWESGDVKPFMHSLHFFYSLGAITGSLISPPFLSKRSELRAPDIIFNATNNLENHDAGSQDLNATRYNILC
jgi:fucose permease